MKINLFQLPFLGLKILGPGNMHRHLDAIGATGDDATGIAAAFANQVQIDKTAA